MQENDIQAPKETMLGMPKYWDNQPAWKAVGDFMLDRYNPPNKSHEKAYNMVYFHLQASHVATSIEQALKTINN